MLIALLVEIHTGDTRTTTQACHSRSLHSGALIGIVYPDDPSILPSEIHPVWRIRISFDGTDIECGPLDVDIFCKTCIDVPAEKICTVDLAIEDIGIIIISRTVDEITIDRSTETKIPATISRQSIISTLG